MQLLTFPLLAIAPGIFWLWFFIRKDIYRPEPKRLIALTFFLGMVSTIPAGLIEAPFLDESVLSDSSLASVAMGMLFVVGPRNPSSWPSESYRTAHFTSTNRATVWFTAQQPAWDSPRWRISFTCCPPDQP